MGNTRESLVEIEDKEKTEQLTGLSKSLAQYS